MADLKRKKATISDVAELLAGWSDSEFATAASGEYCEDLKSMIEGAIARALDPTPPADVDGLVERENMHILLPPASIDNQDYLDGWCEGQAYLIANYGKEEAFVEAIAATDALTAQAAEIARRDVLLHESLQLLDANIRSKTRDDNAEQQLHVKIRRNLTGSQSHD